MEEVADFEDEDAVDFGADTGAGAEVGNASAEAPWRRRFRAAAGLGAPRQARRHALDRARGRRAGRAARGGGHGLPELDLTLLVCQDEVIYFIFYLFLISGCSGVLAV